MADIEINERQRDDQPAHFIERLTCYQAPEAIAHGLRYRMLASELHILRVPVNRGGFNGPWTASF